MSSIAHVVWAKLTGLMPGELDRSELVWLLSPHAHFSLLARRRATMIVNRVRLFAFLFAVLTPLWTIIDYFVFPYQLWLSLAALRVSASVAFALVVIGYKPSGSLPDAYRAIALLFAIPTVFYVASHQLLSGHALAGMSAAIATGYAFLPFVLLAGLAIFPLTFIENVLIASPILFAQALSGYMRWTTLDWPSFAGAFWLLTLITGVSNLAGMSQLAFMIALVRQAIRDPLTGSFSRRSGEETLEMQFTLSRRSNTPLAVAFFDLDHFKRVNDDFGHEAGDQVLTETANRISNNLRRGDMLVRWGGEEFVVVLPNTDLDQARDVLARLRQRGFGTRPDGSPITASIGIAERREEEAEDWHQLVKIADQRMYLAKTSGRNRIIHADGTTPDSVTEIAAESV
ncbi:MAG: GGDEF domain-containing protein [Azospira sp.]|jgi:diguanylate cyclase (GGDEF)-like protein|nr:GGDEF domain-containing protein [Azospira sp.]